MEQQPLNEIRQLLQQKIFGHKCVDNFNVYSRSVFNRLRMCHTAGIGVHHLKCNKTSCSNEYYQYHSCGNRHCPNCGGLKKEQWLQDRISELLPTTYYHIVFTLPQELRSVVMGNRKALFNLLFDAGHHTINRLSANKKWLGAQTRYREHIAYQRAGSKFSSAYTLHSKRRRYKCCRQLGKRKKK